MKRSGLTLAILLCLAPLTYAQESSDFRPASTNVWDAQYPRVDSKGRVEIRLKAPDAAKVRLNFWSGPKIDMVKQPDGVWSVITEPLVPGLHYYTLIVDGVEVADTGSRSFFGGSKYASAVEVPELGSTYYSIQDVPWAMFFHGNYALHGAFWHAGFGARRSHGCINLAVADARWLFWWVGPELPEGWHGAAAREGSPGSVVVVR